MESPAPTINTWAGTNNASTFDTWEDLEFYSCCAQIQLYNPICTVIFLSLLLDVNLAAPVPTHWFKCPEKVRNGLRFCSWATNRILIFQLRSRWVLLCWSNGLKKNTGPTNKLSHCYNAGTTWSHFWAQPRTGFLGTPMHWDWARRSFSVPRSQQKCPANLDRDLVHSKSDQKSNRLRILGTPQKSGNTIFKCNWLKNHWRTYFKFQPPDATKCVELQQVHNGNNPALPYCHTYWKLRNHERLEAGIHPSSFRADQANNPKVS